MTPINPLPFTPDEAELLTADVIIAAALEAFQPSIALACSFQQEESVLLEMAFAARADTRVFALDTGVMSSRVSRDHAARGTLTRLKARRTRFGFLTGPCWSFRSL